jgi:hypothetical protein
MSSHRFQQQFAEEWMLPALALGKAIDRHALADYLRIAEAPIPQRLRDHIAEAVEPKRAGRKGSGKRRIDATADQLWLHKFVALHYPTYLDEEEDDRARGAAKRAIGRMAVDLGVSEHVMRKLLTRTRRTSTRQN